MAATITSTTDQAQMEQDFEKAGIKLPGVEESPKPSDEIVVEEPKPSGKPGETGDAPGKPGDKTASESETGKPKPQEPPSQGEKPKPEAAQPSVDKKIGKLTKQVEDAREQLEFERGDKGKLRTKIEELEAQIAELKPPAKTDEPALVRPKRPQRPELSEVEWDASKFAVAMKEYDTKIEKYDDDMDEYRKESGKRDTAAALKADREQREQETVIANANKQMTEYHKRVRDEGHNEFDDWEEFWAGFPDPIAIPEAANLAIIEDCEHAAFVVRYLAEHPEEIEKLTNSSPLKQVATIARLDSKLYAEHEAAKKASEPPKPNATVETPEKPAPAPPAARSRTPEAPLEPVGGRGSLSVAPKGNAKYAAQVEAGDMKGFVNDFNARLLERQKREMGRS